MAFVLERLDLLDRPHLTGRLRIDAWAWVSEHGERMQRNVGTTPGVRGRRQVISIGFTADFENCNSNAFRDLRAAGEPLAICPALQDFLSIRIALIGLFLDIMKGIKHQQGVRSEEHTSEL